MPHATTKDNVKLYYEEAGSGTPIIFSHEFAGDYRNWELQMRFFSRRHRCITYSARGYKPSDIPSDGNAYTYMHWVSDVVAMLDHLKIDKAHFVGLSMGGYTALMMGVHQPGRALSLTAAGAGSGSERAGGEEFRKTFMTTADEFEKHGSAYVVERYGMGTARISFLVKDPRGFAEFNEHVRLARSARRGAHPARLSGRAAVALRLREGDSHHQGADADRGRRRGRSVSRAELPPQAMDHDVGPGGVPEDRPRGEPGGAGAVQRGGRRLHRPRRGRPLAGARSAVDPEVAARRLLSSSCAGLTRIHVSLAICEKAGSPGPARP